MKKFVFASVMALASLSLVPAPTLRAQDQLGTIQIKDPAEYQRLSNGHNAVRPEGQGRSY